MNIRTILTLISGSAVSDWVLIFRPTYQYRFTETKNEEGEVEKILADEHLVKLGFRPDISLTMAFGLVDKGRYDMPADSPYANENARTVFLDIFHNGALIHRETLLKADRQRCLLPLPKSWEAPVKIPKAQYDLVKLVHTLVGPPTDFDEYFENSGMSVSSANWP